MMFIDLLLGTLLGIFTAAITVLVIATIWLLFNELKNNVKRRSI